MEYYESLGLSGEPFSTSPDPAFFFPSREHRECLNRLEIAIRLRRGLSVILGNVGMGKTTVSRLLIKKFASQQSGFIIRLILDPTFKSEFEFIKHLTNSFGIQSNARSTFEYKNELQNYLLQKGVQDKKIIVLIIDEGQKLTPPYIEVLRTLLNYETNEYKLLQLVIFAQQEFLHKMRRQPNFIDRVNLGYVINPLNEEDTRGLIRFRLRKAGLPRDKALFTEKAMREIHVHSQGYPRRITRLCHDTLIQMIRSEKSMVDAALVHSLAEKEVAWNVFSG